MSCRPGLAGRAKQALDEWPLKDEIPALVWQELPCWYRTGLPVLEPIDKPDEYDLVDLGVGRRSLVSGFAV